MSEERFWFSRKEASELLGISSRTFDDALKRLLPPDASKGSAAKLRYHGPAVIKAWLAYRATIDPTTGKKKTEEAAPNLERIRDHKAALAEMDVQERRGELVNKDAIKRAIAGGFVALRGTGDQLVRRFGNEAGELYNEGIADFESAATAALNAGQRSRDI